jgi:aromatic-L-amino-acid decarboxylase
VATDTSSSEAPRGDNGHRFGDLDLEAFRAAGHEVVDWIAEYLARIEDYPVLSRARPGSTRQQLPAHPPEKPEPLSRILDDFRRSILPGITHWNHPGFMAYFSSSGSMPGIIGELLIAALNVNAMLWRTSPAASELEETTLDWLREMLGLPQEFAGVITDSASMSSFLAVATAREAAQLQVREAGTGGRRDLPRLCIYASEEAHSSVEKAAIAAGLGRDGFHAVPVDAELRMRSDALASMIKRDLAEGWRPACVVATVGTTSTTSIDPVADIADVCQAHGTWLHVDAAHAGVAAILPEMRYVLNGCERADSFVVNPHKWLFTPLDCSALYTRRPDLFKRAFSLVPEYLRTAEGESQATKDYMDYGLQLGRRFRALKLWMVIRAFGVDGLRERIREHIRIGQQFASWVDADPEFERLAPAPFSTICFRFYPKAVGGQRDRSTERCVDALNQALLDAVNDTGEVFLSHTRLRDLYALRLQVSQLRTEERHVRRAWALIRENASRIARERPIAR